MKSAIAATLAFFTLTGSAVAQAPNTNPGAVPSGSYVVDPGHTQVNFSVLHMGFSIYSGRFSNVSGALELNAKEPSKSTLDVTVPVESVSTTSAKLDDELKSADWLDAKSFPTMTFQSISVKPSGKGSAKVTGDLTLHGVTKPVVLTVKFIGSGTNPLSKKYNVGFEITGDVKRSDFGVKTYVPMIGDTVHLVIAGAFEEK